MTCRAEKTYKLILQHKFQWDLKKLNWGFRALIISNGRNKIGLVHEKPKPPSCALNQYASLHSASPQLSNP